MIETVDLVGEMQPAKVTRGRRQKMADRIKFQLDAAEVKLLTMMAENELFRMRFVNPRLPGYLIDPEVLRASQSITGRLTEAMKKLRGFPPPATKPTKEEANLL